MNEKRKLQWKLNGIVRKAKQVIPLDKLLEITNNKEEYETVKYQMENVKNIHISKGLILDDIIEDVHEIIDKMDDWNDYDIDDNIKLINISIRKLRVARVLYRKQL